MPYLESGPSPDDTKYKKRETSVVLNILAVFRHILTVSAAAFGLLVGVWLYFNGLETMWQLRLFTAVCLGIACSMVLLYGATKLQELEQDMRRPRPKKNLSLS